MDRRESGSSKCLDYVATLRIRAKDFRYVASKKMRIWFGNKYFWRTAQVSTSLNIEIEVRLKMDKSNLRWFSRTFRISSAEVLASTYEQRVK